MKKIIYSIILVGLLFGCADNLEQVDPTGPTGDDFFKTERDVQLAVVAAYAGLTNNRSLWHTEMWGLEVLADNGYGIADAPFRNWDSFDFDPSESLVMRFYQYLYIAINRANLVIQNSPQIEDISSSDLNNYLGQMHFLRGYEYFLLTLIFEDVPIILEPSSNPAGFSIPASPASEVYAQIIEDMELAEQLLPETQNEAGRIIKDAATAMLAKVYLFGADELNKPEWYSLAEQKAAQVINSGTFSLIDEQDKTPAENLIKLFTHDNTSEDIFSVQHYTSGGNSNYNVAGQFARGITPRYNRNMNMWGFGWMHTYESVQTQWPESDPRKRVSLFFDEDDIITLGGTNVGKYYSSKTARTDARPDSGGPKKFWWVASDISGSLPDTYLDAKVLRFAELLLIHTEADLMAGGGLSAAGAASFNKVRSRAGLSEMAANEITREVILEERRWELFHECHRWFDLMRTRTVEQAFAKIKEFDTNSNDLEKEGFVPEKNYKMPYPQAALDRNPELVQKAVWAASK
jgi:starch-binding outer membrane protein, SusD/RagB family